MAKKYSCKNCGAELFFDPKSGKLHCDYCGSDFDPCMCRYCALRIDNKRASTANAEARLIV
jgi:DNA-directed RNA polymerase subunit RPC12/RpoP